MTQTVLDRARLRRLFDLRGDAYAVRGGGYTADPYPVFNRLRETGPVHVGAPHKALGWTEPVQFEGLPFPNRQHFGAYDWETSTTVFKDEEHFRTTAPRLSGEPPFPDAAMLFMNDTPHRDYRRLVQGSFIPAHMEWWHNNWIAETVDRMLDGLCGAETADLNIDFCAPIPLFTITGSFGVDLEQALAVREAILSGANEQTELAKLLLPIVARRRTDPQDDLISVLVQAEITDTQGVVQRLDDVGVMSFAFLLLTAGSGTTWKQMGITLLTLLQNPEALAAARESREFLMGAIDETLRWMPTDPVFARFVAKDVELGGVHLPAGAVVHPCLASANRDPARWDRPDQWDPTRNTKTGMGFGAGPHTCLGQHVARAEMLHGIGALLERFPELRLDRSAPASVIGLYERGPSAVPVLLGRPA